MRVQICEGDLERTEIVKKLCNTFTDYKPVYLTQKVKQLTLPDDEITTEIVDKTLDSVINACAGLTVDDNVIFSHSPFDVFARAIRLTGYGFEGFDKQYTSELVDKVRESTRNVDIVVHIRNTVEQKEINNVKYNELLNILNVVESSYTTQKGADVFFPKDDSPLVLSIDYAAISDIVRELDQYIGNFNGSVLDDITKTNGPSLTDDQGREAAQNALSVMKVDYEAEQAREFIKRNQINI